MKILFIHTLDSYTGAAKVGAEIIKSIKKEKDLFYISCDKGAFLENSSNEKNIFTNLSNNKSINFILFQLTGFFYLLKNHKKYDLIFINALGPFLPLLGTFFLRNKRVIQYIHEQKIINPILNFLCLTTTKIVRPEIIYSSYFLKKYHNFNFGISNVLTPPVSENFYKIPPNDLNNKNIVLMVSSLKVYKGVTKFINVSNLFFLDDSNVEFQLVLSCTPSEFNNYLTFNNLKINTNLKILFKPSNIVNIYHSCKVVINLTQRVSIIESYGLSLVEAITCGKPIICPNIGGPFEINQNEKFGLFVDEASEKDIINKIKILLLNEKLYLTKKLTCNHYRNSFSNNSFSLNLNKLLNY